TQIGSNLAMPLVILGLILGALQLVDLGIILFSLAVLFQLVTLPVEFNASSRALATLADGGYVSSSEIRPIRSVLSAAALTYFAALVTALLQWVYLFTRRGRRGGIRHDRPGTERPQPRPPDGPGGLAGHGQGPVRRRRPGRGHGR